MGGFSFHDRHLILDYDEYWFEVDEHRRGDEQFLLAHIWFEKFTPSIWKRVLTEWKTFRSCVSQPVYALCDDGDFQKWKHFVTRLGFKPTGINVICNNGAERQLFIHTVNHERQDFNRLNGSDEPLGSAG